MTSSSSTLPPHLFNILGHMMQLNPTPLTPHHQNHSLHHSRPHLPSQIVSGAVAASSSSEDECPLDFSKKAKKFPSIASSSLKQEEDEDDDEETLNVDGDVLEDDPSSRRLRSALSLSMSMNKSPSKILNLSSNAIAPTPEKESPMSACSVASSSRSWSRTSSPESPLSPSISMDGHQQQLQQVLSSAFVGNSHHHTLSFSPWGMPTFQQNSLSPGSGLEQHQQQLQMQQQLLGFSTQQQTSPTFGISPPVATPTPTPTSHGQGSGGKVRATRPFKAYPKDPMTFPTVSMYGLPLGSATNGTEALLHQQSHQAYAEFRKQMLASSQCGRTRRASSIKGGSSEDGLSFSRISVDTPFQDESLSSSKRMSGSGASGAKSEQQMKDDAYWERRRKNNEAAKRSRDARRAKEDEIAIRAAFLEQENLKLRYELVTVKNENAKFRCLYST